MYRALLSLALYTWLHLLFAAIAFGQGLPTFHTVQANSVDAIDLGTLNVVVNAPIRNKVLGEFSYGVNINSAPVVVQPLFREVHSGGASFQTFSGTCPNGTATTKEIFWIYTDANGTIHKFPNIGTSAPAIDTKHCLTQVLSGVTTDQSGYTLVINPTTYVATVYDISGGSHTLTSFVDANGNSVSSANNVWTDVLAETPLFQVGSTNTSVTYGYTDAAGASRQIVVSDGFKTWQTACGATTNSLNAITNISYPDGTSMQFTYEPTSTGSTHITGRFASIALRTGGVINYTYSGGTSGINCTSNTTAILKRTTSDGTWTFDTTKIAGSTVVTDPSGNDTVYTFISGLEIYRKIYQGSYASGTLLLTKGICYNGAAPNCSSQSTIPSSVSSIDEYTYIPGVANPSRVTKTFDTYGNITSVSLYDFGATSFTSQTNTTYGSWNGSSCAAVGNYIAGLPCDVSTTDGVNIKSHSRFSYNVTGNLTSLQKWSGSMWLTKSETRNANGTIATETGVNGALRTFSYGNGCNNVLPTRSSIAGLSISWTWDCNGGVVTSSTDANNQTNTFTYMSGTTADPLYRILSSVDPTGNTLTYAYTPTSNQMSMNFGSSITNSLTTVDGFGRVISLQRQQAPNSIDYDTVSRAYDTNGRLYTVSLPCTATAGGQCPTIAQEFAYDALNRVIDVSNPGSGGFVSRLYTDNDLLVTLGPASSGENTKRKQYEYDGLGRLSSVCEITGASGSGACGQAVSATGYKTLYSYDILGNIASVNQGTQTRSFTYDGLSRRTSEDNPESGATTYVWDTQSGSDACTSGSRTSAGDLLKRIDANGNYACFVYDSLHRVTDTGNNSENSTNHCTRFRYDSASNAFLGSVPSGVTVSNIAGRLMEATTDNCSLPPSQSSVISDEWLSYDANGRKTDLFESTAHSGGYYHTSTVYAANGTPTSLSGIPGENAFSYGLDGEGRWSTSALSGSMNFVTGTTYNAAGQPLTISIGSGSTDNDTYSYDSSTGQMKTFAFTIGATPATFQGTLLWNANGTIQSLAISDGFNSGGTQTCDDSYDDLGRIAANNCGSVWTQTFGYDQYGNITKSGSASWMPGYNSSTNRYTLTGTTYDADGQLLTDTFHTYTWDVYGKISTVDSTACGSNGTCMTYDAFGRMVEKNKSGVVNEILYTPLGKFGIMSGQTIVTGRIQLPGGGTILLCCGNRVYQHKDWLGSVRFGHGMWSRTTYIDTAVAPFGETYDSQLNGSVDPNFTGHSQDSIVSEFDTTMRQLHPGQGRWLSPDPAALGAADSTTPQTWNRYAYVANMSMTEVDPSGLCGVAPGYSGCHGIPLPHFLNGDGGDDDGFGSLDCTCGNDIFDAIAGTPGTYLYYDMKGNLSWGFSISLMQSTDIFIDNTRNKEIENGITNLGPYPTSGFQVTVTWDGQALGLVPQYVNAVNDYNEATCYGGCAWPWGLDAEWVNYLTGLNDKIADLGTQIVQLAVPLWNPNDPNQ